MYIHTSAFQNLLPGEPSPEALHREEYHEEKAGEANPPVEPIDPADRQRAQLLRAKFLTAAGSWFA